MDPFPIAATINQVERLTYSLADLCRVVGLSEETMRKKLPDLQARGFPGRIPGLNCWSRPAVDDWIAHSGGEYRPYAERRPAHADAVAEVAAALEEEYGGREAVRVA